MAKKFLRSKHFWFFVPLGLLLCLFILAPKIFSSDMSYIKGEIVNDVEEDEPAGPLYPPLDKAAYDQKMIDLANNPPPPAPVTKVVKDPKTGVETTVTVEPKPSVPKINLWPAKTVYPNDGAILPFRRIIAYYGNLYSTKMGALGQDPPEIMLPKLMNEVKKWELADPSTPPLPALHYIAVVAQGSAGADGKYRARMPESEIDKVLALAARINAIVFLDIQVGFYTLQSEIPHFEKYLKLPQVHLGIDAEFSMKGTIRPGKVVGTFDAADINYAANYLAKVVRENNLPPKVLVVHRYTQNMITNYKLIKPLPEVQMVMHMDGWGGKAKKKNTYQQFVYKEPVQFTGFKLFYKNDVFDPGTVLFEPSELIHLRPIPSYIQYQ